MYASKFKLGRDQAMKSNTKKLFWSTLWIALLPGCQALDGLFELKATQLRILSEPQTLEVGECSAPVEVGRINVLGDPAPLANNISVTLEADGLTFFEDENCLSPMDQVLIEGNSYVSSFYFSGEVSGRIELRALTEGLVAGVQIQTITDPQAEDPTEDDTTTAEDDTPSEEDEGTGASSPWVLFKTQFESSLDGFYVQNEGQDSLQLLAQDGIENTSLSASLTTWGSNLWWLQGVSFPEGTTAPTHFKVTADFLRTNASSSNLLLCADVAYVGDSRIVEGCSSVVTLLDSPETIVAELELDSTRQVSTAYIRVTLDGASSVNFLMDNVVAEWVGGEAPVDTETGVGSDDDTNTDTTEDDTGAESEDSGSVADTDTDTDTGSSTSDFVTGVGGVEAIWANDGGDKVLKHERRALDGASSVSNRVWQNKEIHLFGARNEVVQFNVILEAGDAGAENVSVALKRLEGPSGRVISRENASVDNLYDWTVRPIELFYVRYLQIKGLSALSYETYDERLIPTRMRRPWSGSGIGSGAWGDRPGADRYFPEIAAPIELHPSFKITARENQSIWSDIYLSKDLPAGDFTGVFEVRAGGEGQSVEIPVRVTVLDFELQDTPASKTMVYLGYQDISRRYLGESWPNSGTANAEALKKIRDNHFLMAHRHKLSLIDDHQGPDVWQTQAPRPEWQRRLSGDLFTAQNGYAGPGEGQGNGIFSIGTYGSWSWRGGTQDDMWKNTDAWETWFVKNSPETERFLYLIDESTNYSQTETWANWVLSNPGVGGQLATFATLALPEADANIPSLSIAASWMDVGMKSRWQAAANDFIQSDRKRFYMYNGKRPASGSFATEDEGVALRELPWGQFKKGVHRWFFWESTYYNDYQGGRGNTNVFQTAQTFGGSTTFNSVLGQRGWNSSNGDGVLFYPGTDRTYSEESYGVSGPIASLRLKHWRRGVQDIDYVAAAMKVDPVRTQAIVERMVPKALWEYDVADTSDPTWQRTDVSWSVDPDDWEAARAELAEIILQGQP